MAKPKTEYVCQACGAVSNKWMGKCEDCGEWNTFVEQLTQKSESFSKIKGAANTNGLALKFEKLSGDVKDAFRIKTNINELDQVLGGGLVPGSAILIGGDPGIGKSTLLLQLLAHLANKGINSAYVSGEESLSQISLRAVRLEVENAPIKMLAATNLQNIISTIRSEEGVQVAVIDSIQTMFIDELPSAPGTVAQVRACAHELIRLAKELNIILLIVGHVTKEGQIAGPKVLEHMVDTVLYFEGERGHQFRILRAVKNRFGGINEIGVFEMCDLGLKEVSNPSALFLSDRANNVSGAAIFAGIEGTRPILAEIQALVAPTFMATPRRAVVGWDQNRLAMIIAVLATRFGLNLTDKEVYLNITGGLKINEPAADLAVAAALISAATNVPIAQDTVIFGEVGLSGEIRQVSQSDARIKEALRLGFNKVIMPYAGKDVQKQDNFSVLKHIKQLKEAMY
ncbi:MAG: DNA repair protein RadA [Sphingobacteriia bacterium]|nr:DNA repair protein RadA [Sphingobacteriia bacterium]